MKKIRSLFLTEFNDYISVYEMRLKPIKIEGLSHKSFYLHRTVGDSFLFFQN